MAIKQSFVQNLTAEEEVTLNRYVNESIYDLKEWGDAFFVFDDWLNENKKKATFTEKLLYLSCCAEYGKDKGFPVPLAIVLKEMLTNAGFEAME